MKSKQFANLPALERIKAHAATADAALESRLAYLVSRFKLHHNAQRREQIRRWKEARWPYAFTIKDEEIGKLIRYLRQLRGGETPTWMRGPWVKAMDGTLCRSQLPTSNDGEPANTGEEFAALLRRYWQLAFGYVHGRTQVEGVGAAIFKANEIDPLSVALLLRQDSGETMEQIANEVKPLAVDASRSNAPTSRTLKETVRQRLRDLGKARRK